MLQIDKTIISFDVLEKKFFCDLNQCKGACCIHGDSGAPLKKEEADCIDELYPVFKTYMRKEGIDAIEKQGCYITDKDGDLVTTLINNEECVFVIFERGVAKCAIEKAFEDKVITFRKPISCHLYPIRVTPYSTFEALNYHTWDICKSALLHGNTLNTPLYVFLKEPLIREYGKEWYEQLEIAASEINLRKHF